MVAIAGAILLVVGLLGLLDALEIRPALEIILVLAGLILIVVDPRVRAKF